MKKIRICLALVLICAVCISICACGLNKEDVIGVWSCTYEFDGSEFYNEFTLSADGTYSKTVHKNGSISSNESGTWTIEGNKVCLFESENSANTEYTYRGGKLINADHKFTKK